MWAFNRTIVELKRLKATLWNADAVSFNRAIVELKHIGCGRNGIEP